MPCKTSGSFSIAVLSANTCYVVAHSAPPLAIGKIMNSILFRQRLWESFPTKTVGKLSDKLCGNSCLNCSKFIFYFFMNIRLIYIHLGMVAHALGKGRPHVRPRRRGAGRRSGLRLYPPLGAVRSFSIVAPSPRANRPCQ